MHDAWKDCMTAFRDTANRTDPTIALGHVRQAKRLGLETREPSLSVAAMHAEASFLSDLGRDDDAIDALAEAILLARRHPETETDLGDLYLFTGRLMARLELLPDAIDHLELAASHLTEPETRLEAYMRMADCARRLGWNHVAMPSQQECVSLSLNLYELEDPRTLRAIVGLGESYRVQGLLLDAKAIFDVVLQAVGDLPARTPAQTAELASALHNMGLVLAAIEPERARQALTQALAHLRTVVGESHPFVARTHMVLGLLDESLGHPEQARSQWQTAIAPLPDDDPLRPALTELLAVE